MRTFRVAVAATAVAVLAAACARPAGSPAPERPPVAADGPAVAVRVDSSRNEMVVLAGPFRVAATGARHGSAHHHGSSELTDVLRFDWPVAGWMRGFRLTLVDGRGMPLSRALLHHALVVNYDRRQLVYPMVERLVGLSNETQDIELPWSLAVPLQRGQHLGFYAAWRNDTGREVDAVYVRLTFLWTPATRVPRPTAVLPMYLDVDPVIARSGVYDIPPGGSSRSSDFEVPIDGRLLGVGGHLHDYGRSLRLEDLTTGRVLVTLRARRDASGRVTGVQRKMLGLLGRGLRLRAGRRYRLVGEYDNALTDTIRSGGMAHMVGAFAPDDLASWPKLDLSNADLRRDLAALPGADRARREGALAPGRP
jgi:hypothetical protein